MRVCSKSARGDAWSRSETIQYAESRVIDPALNASATSGYRGDTASPVRLRDAEAAEQPRFAQRDESNRGQYCGRTVFSQPSGKPLAPESHTRSVTHLGGESSDFGINRATLRESILERAEQLGVGEIHHREVLKGRRVHVRSLAVTTDISRADIPFDQDFLWIKATKVRLWRSRAAQEEEAHPQLLVDDGDGNRGARLGEPSLSRAE